MRRHRRNYLSGLFFTSGNYGERSMAEDFGFSRQYTETVSQGMINDERIEQSHRQEGNRPVAEEHRKEELSNKFTENIINTPRKGEPNCL